MANETRQFLSGDGGGGFISVSAGSSERARAIAWLIEKDFMRGLEDNPPTEADDGCGDEE